MFKFTPFLLAFAMFATAQDSTKAAPVVSSPEAATAPIPVVSNSVTSPDSVKLEPSPWKKQAVGNFNVSTSYFHDWAQGGEDNFAWTLKLLASAERDGKEWNWMSKGSAEFGQIKLGDRGLRKTSDELKTETVLSRKLSKYLNPFVSAALQTQFARGYKYPADSLPRVAVSDFLDPLYLTQSAGLGSKPTDWFQTRLGAAVREVRADEFTNYTDDAKTTEIEGWKVEPGAEWISEYKQTVSGNLLLQSTFSAFANFKGWDEIVVAWTNNATFQFTKFVNVNASAELRHDKQQIDAWQWKQVFALGLAYNFI